MLGKHINRCEDSLTASIISQLLHLPFELFWQILGNACFTNKLPLHLGEPVAVEPWPNWNPEKTENSNRVVPDVFLRFDNFDVIIEAKRWDSRQQNPHQWKKEFTAYLNEYGSENVSAIMIAIGGVWETADEEVVVSNIRCPVYMCKWERILSECQRMEKELHRRKYNSSQSLAHRRILLDVIDLFSWHGYQTGVWYEDIASKFRLEPSFDSHFHVFRNISAQLSRS